MRNMAQMIENAKAATRTMTLRSLRWPGSPFSWAG